jgi:hypothetical protein
MAENTDKTKAHELSFWAAVMTTEFDLKSRKSCFLVVIG